MFVRKVICLDLIERICIGFGWCGERVAWEYWCKLAFDSETSPSNNEAVTFFVCIAKPWVHQIVLYILGNMNLYCGMLPGSLEQWSRGCSASKAEFL